MNRFFGSFGALSALVGLLVLGGSVPARGEDGVTDKEVVHRLARVAGKMSGTCFSSR